MTTNTGGEVAPRGFIDRPAMRWFMGAVLIGGFMRLIRRTSTLVLEPPDQWEWVEQNWPVILTCWHGQANLAHLYTPRPKEWGIMSSNHPDGRMGAAMSESFGFQTIDGSGANYKQRSGTGGLKAFRDALRFLAAGKGLVVAAQVPPEPGRKPSVGVIRIARKSGRPLMPIATSSSRRKVTRNWDEMPVNLPFSKLSYVFDEPLWVTDPAISDEDYAAELGRRCTRALQRAQAIVDQADSTANT